MTRPDQLKAMSEPLRIRMVETLVRTELPIADLARRLGQPLSKLYHHVDVLLEAGLIQITRRVQRRGTEERWFRAVAKDYTVDDSIFSFEDAKEPGPEALIELTESVFRGTMEEIAAAARAGTIDQKRPGRRFFLETQTLGLTEADFTDLCERLDGWIDQAKARQRSGKATTYRLLTAFFPAPARSSSRSR